MEVQERKVFVCGLAPEVDEETLAQYFTKYGSVWRTFVVRDRITKNHKGHGFVWFSDSSSAKLALEDSTGHVILGKSVSTKFLKICNVRSFMLLFGNTGQIEPLSS